MKPDRCKILLVDDHAMFRYGIRKIIDEVPHCQVVGEAVNGMEALALAERLRPHVVILDMAMPDLGGIEVTRRIKRMDAGTRVLILTMHRNREYFYHAIGAGADGFLLKQDEPEELITAVQRVMEGKHYISRLMSDEMVQTLRSGHSCPIGRHEPLTAREREVLRLIASGKSNQEIADVLCISMRTVYNHRANIAGKLRTNRTADLVRYAILHGVVPLDEFLPSEASHPTHPRA